jgi:hypothetical protein
MKVSHLLLQVISLQPDQMETFSKITHELTDHFVLIIFYYIYDE